MHLRLRWILLISFLTFWTGFITYIETDYKPTETTKDSQQATVRIKPEQLEFVSDTPTQLLSYNCIKVKSIKINNAVLSSDDMKKICQSAYSFTLQNGVNNIIIEIDTASGIMTENLAITFDEVSYKAKKEAEIFAEAQAQAQKEIDDFAAKYEINSKLAKNIINALPGTGIQKDNISSITKTTNWANGERYLMIYSGIEILIYLNKNQSINSMNYGDVKLYQSNGKTKSIENYLLTTSDMSQLKIWARNVVTAVLKAPSTAEFPGGFLSPFDGWGFSRNGNIYEISSYVDSQNSFGAMIRSDFYLKITWDKSTDETTIKSFVFDGERVI